MKYLHTKHSHYLLSRVFFHKSLEVGIQDTRHYSGLHHKPHFNIFTNLSFRGRDHAGLRFGFELGHFFIELNLVDCRHWNYEADRWLNEGESERILDCDDNYDSSFLHGENPGPDGLGSTFYKDDSWGKDER